MNELQAQKLIVDAVRGSGGFAFKMSHRFLVGVPDLFIKLPQFSVVSLWECKINDTPKKGETVKLDITPLQRKFLNDFFNAGGVCGVVSFLRSQEGLKVCIARQSCLLQPTVIMNIDAHILLKTGHLRRAVIMDSLIKELVTHI